MKGKKDGIIWSIVLIGFSIVIFFVLQFHLYTDGFKNIIRGVLPFELSEWREFVMVIMSGIFTSSFVTLIMNYSDYKNERRDALVNYYLVSSRFMRNFRNIEYLYVGEEIELIRNFYLERSSNNMCMQMGMDKELKYKAKLALQEWIWKNESRGTRRQFRKIKQQYLSDCVESLISKYDQELDKIIAQYIELSELNYREVEDAYGNINFLFTNKLNRNEFIYKYLHERQRNLLHKIKMESYHFKNHYTRDTAVVMLDKILELQKEIFAVEESKYGKNIYNQYCYEITCNLEFLLQLTYKDKYEANYPCWKEFYASSHIDMQKLESVQNTENQD